MKETPSVQKTEKTSDPESIQNQFKAPSDESSFIQQQALNQIQIRIFWKDLNSVYQGCNQIFAEDAGLNSPEEVIGHTDYDFWIEQADAFRNDDQYVMSSGQAKLNFEEPQTTPEGDIAWLNTNKLPLKDSSGKIYGVLGIYEDITERKLGKILLRDRKAELEQIFTALPEALVYTNVKREIIRVNPAFTSIFGYTSEEVIGKTTELLYENNEDFIAQAKNNNTASKSKTYEINYCHKNGKSFPSETISTHVRDGANNLVGQIKLIRDITRRKQTENEIATQKSFLQLVIDSVPNYIFVKDIESRFKLINKALADDFGASVKDIIGKLDSDFSPKEEEFKQFNNDDYEVITTGEEKFIPEEKMTTAKGELRWLQTIKRPIVDNDGATFVLGVCADITERKLIEEKLQETQQFLETAIAQSPSGILIADAPDANIRLANPAALNVRGAKNDTLTNIDITKHAIKWQTYKLDGTPYPSEELPLSRAILNGETIQAEDLIIRHENGEHHYVSANAAPIRNKKGDITAGIVIFNDITERMHAEEELHKLKRAVESSSSVVFITDLDGKIEYTNPKFTEVTGYKNDEVIGENPSILQSSETSNAVYADMWKTISSGKEWKNEFLNRKKDGSLYWARNAISCVKNKEGKITHYLSIHEDVTREYELSEKINYQATHDNLTGLINRHEFERRLERLLTTVHYGKQEHALCFMDLDQFKVVNDTCGHIAGDELLRQLSSLLKEKVRHRDTLARLGGDEFAVLMEHCTLEHAQRVAISLQKLIQDYQLLWEGRSFKIGVSIGLVSITDTTANLTELLRDADAACYMAKDLGRNRIHVYHSEDKEIAQRHGEIEWVTRINQALDENRFCLYAQAINPLNDSRNQKRYELLIRMLDVRGEIIPPGAFLPSAERYNIISKLDYWVIQNVFTLLSGNSKFRQETNYVSINISGASLTNPEILEFIIKHLDTSALEAEKLCFEITETAAISNLSKAITFISKLKSLGCRFALDDFGSGLSSFAYLKNLPVDYLKIDGIFVKDIADDPIDRAMVKSINEIGHVMGMKTIAEFVENDVVKSILKEIGVDYAQGYGIGKPQPFDALLKG